MSYHRDINEEIELCEAWQLLEQWRQQEPLARTYEIARVCDTVWRVKRSPVPMMGVSSASRHSLLEAVRVVLFL